MALVAAAVLCQVAIPPLVGLADNGDFPRVMARFLLGSDIQSPKDRFFSYFISRYRFDPAFNWDGGFRSSQDLLVWASMPVNSLLSKDGWFELRSLAIVYLAVLLGVMWLLLRYARGMSLPRRVTIYGLALVMFTDVGYVSYFNSFYSEPASYVFLLAAFAAALLLIEAPSWPLLALWALAALLFVTAKPQNAPLGVIVAAYSARLAVLNGERRWRVASIAIALAVLAVSAVYYAITPRKMVVMTSQYVAVFSELLAHSPAPERDLVELGLSPALGKYAGTHPYMPAVPFGGQELRQAFFDQIHYGKIILFYCRHPGRLWGLLDRSATFALRLRPGLGNFEQSAGYAPFARSGTFAWWSGIRRSLFPASLLGLLLFFGLNATGAAALYWRQRLVKNRMYLELAGALMTMAGMQFLLVALAEGTIDPIKHMFLFSLLFDLVLAMALVWLVGIAPPLRATAGPAAWKNAAIVQRSWSFLQQIRPMFFQGWLILPVIALLGAIPRLYLGVHHHIEYDGYWDIFIASQNTWNTLRWELAQTAHPPLFYLFLKLPLLVDSTRLVCRSIPLLAGLGSIILVGKIVGTLSRQPFSGPLAALAFGGSMAAIVMSVEVRPYMLATFFVLAAFHQYVTLLRADAETSPGAETRFTVFSILALLTHYYTAFFLMACAVYPAAVAVANREYRCALLIYLTKRRVGLATRALAIVSVAGCLYAAHGSRLLLLLNHLPEHYYQPGRETLLSFLLRNAHNTFNLFAPIPIPRGEDFLSLAMTFVVLLVLAFHLTPFHRKTEDVPAAAPLSFSLLIVGLIVIASVMGKYPFGGRLRHQFIVFPFLLTGFYVFLDRLAGLVKEERFRKQILVLCAMAVAYLSVNQIRAFPVLSKDHSADQIRGYYSAFPRPQGVYLDQYNLIAFFIHHRDWSWRHQVPWSPGQTIEQFRLEKDGARLLVFRDKTPRWNLDLLDEGWYKDLAECVRNSQLPELTLLCIRQVGAWPDTPDFRRRVEVLAGRHNLQVRKLVLDGSASYAAFAPFTPPPQTPAGWTLRNR